jgi:uncharacterized membrane protein YoaK (UPF0700 family)
MSPSALNSNEPMPAEAVAGDGVHQASSPVTYGLGEDFKSLVRRKRDERCKGAGRTLIKLLSPDARAQRRLAMCLALIAGYVDAYGIVALGTFVSFMSGNTTMTGSFTGKGNFVSALPPALAIVFFVAGAFAGTLLTHSGLHHSRRLLLGLVAGSLAMIIGVTQLGWLNAEVGIATLALAMGMMNTAQSRVGAEAVSLTFVTGDLHKIASHLALAVKRVPLQDAQGTWDTHLRRARLLASVWAAFLIGAVLSGPATSYFGVWVLLPPLLILLTLAVVAVPLAPHNVPIELRMRSSLQQGAR